MDSIMPDKHTLSDLDKIAPPMLVKAFLFYNPPPDLSRLIESLQEGLKNAVHHLPFLAGDVQVDKDSGNGKPCIVMPSGGQGLELCVRYFSDDEHRSFSVLEGDSFPANLEYTRVLPESLLPPPLGDGIKPVCAIQLNVLGDGGLVLGFTMHHSVGDWTSLAVVLGLVCRGSKAWYSWGEMPGYQANLDKGPFNGLAGLPQGELLKSCPGYYILDCTVPPAPKQQHPPYQANIYRITESTIKQLKQHCSSTLPDDVQYVTSYDCISAVLWTSITRARLRRYPEKASARSIFMHPVNLRTRDPEQETSLEYFGNACLPAQAGPVDAQLLGCATNESVSTAASCIRRSINNISLPSVKPLAALIRTLSPSELLGYHMNFHDMDMLMNSWYSGKAEDYEIGGPGGVPRAFRTQRPITGACCLVLPDFGGSGGTKVFDVFVQLEEGLQEALQEDSEFVRYFRVVA